MERSVQVLNCINYRARLCLQPGQTLPDDSIDMYRLVEFEEQ